MSWTGGHSGSGLPPGLAWGAAGSLGPPPPMPPSHHAGHYRQQSGRHEQDKQAAARRRKEEARQQRAEQRRVSGPVDNDNLFSAPRKTDGVKETEVGKVLGDFKAAQSMMAMELHSFCGVDYAPPTPAPAKEHIIGEEDEEEPSHQPPPARPRPPPFPSNRQHPSHMMGQILKPPPPKSSRSSSGGSGSMAPPSSLPVKSHKHQSQPSNNVPKKQPTQPKLSPLKMPSQEKKPVAPSNEDVDADMKAIFQEMKHPYPLSDNGGLPTPLTGIVTPRVEVEDRGAQKHKPVYSTIFNPFQGEDSSGKSPPRKNSESMSEKRNPSSSKAHEGSSSSDSSSGSDSEESDDKDANNSEFSLTKILQTSKTSPGMSERSVKPTPSPRYPAPSPLYSSHPTPSPAALATPATPATPYSGDNNDDPGSPAMPSMNLPALLNPLSPMRDSEPESEQPTKQSAGKIRHSVSSSKLSSDDEDERNKIKEKQRKSSKHRSRKSSNKSGSERVKSRKVVTEDSDSEPDVKPHIRSLSNSPIKKPSSKKLGSAHSTPRQRPSSTQSTPARPEKLSESLNSLVSSSKSRKGSSSKQQSRSKAARNLSEDSDDDEGDQPQTRNSPATSSNKKNSILTKMFMFKGSSGGKGKDKGRAAGGITVMDREESDEIDDEQPVVTKAKSSPNIKSSRSSHKGSPAVKIEKDKDSSWLDNNRENSALVANSMKQDTLDGDLTLSDDSLNSPVISRHAPTFPLQAEGKPSLLVSIPLSRLGRPLDTLHSKFKQKSRKPPVKQECWITSGDEKGSSGGGRKRKPSESPAKEKLCSPDPSHVRHSSGSSKPCDNLSVQHRKSKERTLHCDSEQPKPESSRKRRDRDSSQGRYDSDHSSKRMRTTPAHQDTFSSETIQDNYYNQDMEPPPPDPSLLPASQSSWPAPGNIMMPPPYPPKRVYYSYFERKHQEEEFDDEESVVDEATRVKREADSEENMYIKCRKYLQAVMMFVVCGSRTEILGDKSRAYDIFIQTMSLTKFVLKLMNSSRNNGDVDIRLVVFSLRAQSLLNLKLYQMKRHDLKDCQKTIQDVLAKSGDDPSGSDQGQNRAEQMSTPSPAGSDGSRSSDYYSSGENRLSGVLTPPTAPTVCLSIPKNVMQNQYNFCSYLSQCHELWEQADLFVSRGMFEDFFINLDQECGPLTLHSSLKDLVNYTRKGLESIEHGRDRLSQSQTSMMCATNTDYR